MLSFRSEVFPDLSNEKINYSNKILFLGSCFAENIGLKLQELKFQININPFGIIYNPASIAQSLEFIMASKKFDLNDLEFNNEKWISFNHHGKFSSNNFNEVIQNINNEIVSGNDYLKKASHIFITFGTARVYKLKKTSGIVANCHKLPAHEFDYYALSVQEILNLYVAFINKIRNLNEKVKIIFTVSPVRHWKDGPVENQYSKSILLVAIHELVKQFDFVSYFPAYEIMMDDLRDYRFYADDLFHPNQLGINYIWDKFKKCFFSDEALDLATKIEKIIKATQHRVFYPQTLSYKNFLMSCIGSIKELTNKHPEISFNIESNYFENELEKYFND